MKTLIALLLFAASAFAQASHYTVLTWAEVQTPGTDAATGFIIQRAPPCSATGCTGPGTFVTIGTTTATVLTYTDNNVSAGETFYYQILATSGPPGGGTSLPSNVVSATTPFSVPSPPSALSAIPK